MSNRTRLIAIALLSVTSGCGLVTSASAGVGPIQIDIVGDPGISAPGVVDAGGAGIGVNLGELPGVGRTVGAADPDGGGGGNGGGTRYVTKKCNGHSWNDGTATGNKSTYTEPCIGNREQDHLIGTTVKNSSQTYADIMQGREGQDFLEGGEGNDVLYGSYAQSDRADDGYDLLVGGPGRDKLFGAGGADVLLGGPDPDEFFTQDGEVDRISCADDKYQARTELDIDDTVDHVWIDRKDILDDSCAYAAVHYNSYVR